MTRSVIVLSGLFAAVIAGCSQPKKGDTVTITGTVSGDAKVIYLENYANRVFHVIDSSKVGNGTFQFTLNVPVPEYYGLSVDTSALAALSGQRHPDTGTLPFFIEKGDRITVEFDTLNNFKNSTITGSAATDLYRGLRKDSTIKIQDFIKEHPASIVSAFALFRHYTGQLSIDEIQKNIALLDTSLTKTQYVQQLNRLVNTAQVGTKAIDFTLPDVNGKPISLSEKIGKNYVLLEFWASWCPVCRKENPNLVKNYLKYKDKGFDVFAVSLDKNKEAWQKAIKDFGLKWTQVSDLKLWNDTAIQLYGFRGTPSNVLIDPQGNIIARNLFGDRLSKKLEEVLPEKI
ncbi:alkyl hydroperoxide reductase [Solitalea longa]|uniref:Alkyl hydroperoxide reductase n=1 Tax=Solitalea longa TaxID=2079460 RepID=A0A2S5A8P9_9SPHI|nr:TlpA disulfide reductase family protein [Solitalea longa]POY38970.1 alkyl hydroperoxide reductase [Solitalea longa]